MNTDMLRDMVGMTNGIVNAVHIDSFFSRYPQTVQNLQDLDKLKKSGCISVFTDNGVISAIFVNLRGIEYVK